MAETWLLAAITVLGMATGQALAAYAGWMIRLRSGAGFAGGGIGSGAGNGIGSSAADGVAGGKASMAASLVNGFGWLAARLVCEDDLQAAELALMVSSAVVFTLIDVRIRVIPNELVAALLALSAALALLEGGIAALPERVVGFLVALTLFLVAMLIAGHGKVGGGDVKLAAAVGFATGFPGVLAAVLVMALAAVAAGAAGMMLKRLGRKTPMPFAGFLTAGLVAAMILERTGILASIP